MFQWAKFEAPSYDRYLDIIITNFQCPNLQREIIRKKIISLFLNFHQVIYSSSSISSPSLKLLDIIFSKYLDYKFSKSKICKGGKFEKNKITCLKFSPGNLLILYQVTKFEAPSYNIFLDIMNTNFLSPNLQREIIR